MDNKFLIEQLNKLINWKQNNTIHCKNTSCKGMLLESEDTYTFKCSDCGRYWDEYTKWKELTEVN